MYVKNCMTAKPYTITPDASIAEAVELMRAKNVRRLPVTIGSELVGIITERQLSEVSPSSATSLSIFEINYLLSKTKIGSVMSREIILASPDELIEEAAVKIRDNNVGALPVVENGKLVGIITEKDIFDAFLELSGFGDVGSRISMQFGLDHPGILSKLSTIFSEQGVNITHIFVHRNEIVIRANAVDCSGIVAALEQNGFTDIVVSLTK